MPPVTNAWQSIWLPLIVAGVPSIIAAVAAVLASRSASKARKSEHAAEDARLRQQQISQAKTEMYQPMLETLRKMLDQTKAGTLDTSDPALLETISKFMAWVQIYGSDEAVVVYHKFQQAAFHSAPPEVVMYLYGRFILAARRDLGPPNTKATAGTLLGMRITDVWTSPAANYDKPELEVFRAANWTPPWPNDFGKGI